MNFAAYTLSYSLTALITIVTLLKANNAEASNTKTSINKGKTYDNLLNLNLLQTDNDVIIDYEAEDPELDDGERDEFDRGMPGIATLNVRNKCSDYLGVGYDAIFGNTLGSEDSLLDPGYRAPIINFEWRKNSQGYSPTLKALYPLNGWVRPVYSCGRSSKVEEIHNLDELRSAFSASAQLRGDVPSASFSASAKYKKEAANIANKRERVYIHTDKCIRYQAGMPLNIPWEVTESFEEAAESLDPLDANVKHECSIHDLIDTETKKACRGLKKWITFFQIFGTHYVHQITLGGKLVQTVKFNAETLEELKNSGVNVDTAVSTALGAVKAGGSDTNKADAKKIDEVGYRTLTVIGGEMPELPINDQEFAIWANAVAENPMPIGLAAESIKRLLNRKLHKSYAIALYKYAEMNGITYETLMQVQGRAGGLIKEIKNGEQVVTVNWNFNGAECQGDKKILLGFSLLFNPQGSFIGIIPCKSGTHKCNVPINRDVIRSVSWAICTTGLQPNIIQVADVTKDKHNEIAVSCPQESVVQFGIKLLANNDRLFAVKPCIKGESTCKATKGDKNAAGIWVVCAPETYLLENINVVASLSGGEDKVICGQKENIIAGIKVLFMENKHTAVSARRSMRIEMCEKFLDSCGIKCQDGCLTSFVMALCADTNNIKT